jgi:hypothetical protein
MNSQKYRVGLSKIQGRGVLLNQAVKKDEPIGVGIWHFLGFYPMITADFGSWINHSWTPNAHLKWNTESGVWEVISSQDLPRDSELTLDYRDTPFYVKKPDKNWK